MRPVPRLLFVATDDFVGSDRLVFEMARQGMVCHVLARRGAYCAATRGASARYFLPRQFGIGVATRFLSRRLESITSRAPYDLIVPLDHGSAMESRRIAMGAQTSPRLRELLDRSLGSPRGYRVSCCRADLMDLAARLGLRTPATRRIASLPEVRAAIAEWGYPVVLKAENSFGGSGVTIVEDEAGIEGAFDRAAARVPSHRDRWKELAGAGLTAQSYVSGMPAMRTVSAWRGRVLAGASFVAERVHPTPLGQSTVLRPVDNAEMTTTVERLVEQIGCSGFVSFDFIIDSLGRAHLIEMNARAIPATYLGRMAGGDVCAALAAHLAGEPAPRSIPLPAHPRKIALFPQELERDPTLASLDDETVLHDVPFDDHKVLQRYVRRLSRIHPGRSRLFEGYLAASRVPNRSGSATARTWKDGHGSTE